jgi:hypothetical protein
MYSITIVAEETSISVKINPKEYKERVTGYSSLEGTRNRSDIALLSPNGQLPALKLLL